MLSPDVLTLGSHLHVYIDTVMSVIALKDVNMNTTNIYSKFLSPFGSQRTLKVFIFKYVNDDKNTVWVYLRTTENGKRGWICLDQYEMHKLLASLRFLEPTKFGLPKREVEFRKFGDEFAITLMKYGTEQKIILTADEVKAIVDADLVDHLSIDEVDWIIVFIIIKPLYTFKWKYK